MLKIGIWIKVFRNIEKDVTSFVFVKLPVWSSHDRMLFCNGIWWMCRRFGVWWCCMDVLSYVVVLTINNVVMVWLYNAVSWRCKVFWRWEMLYRLIRSEGLLSSKISSPFPVVQSDTIFITFKFLHCNSIFTFKLLGQFWPAGQSEQLKFCSADQSQARAHPASMAVSVTVRPIIVFKTYKAPSCYFLLLSWVSSSCTHKVQF